MLGAAACVIMEGKTSKLLWEAVDRQADVVTTSYHTHIALEFGGKSE